MSYQVLLALPVTAAFAALAYRLGMASPRGVLGGILVGVPVYAGLGPQGFAVLVLFVVGGSALTRLGYDRKRRAGGAQEHGGRRGARNALANAGVAVLCAVLYALGFSEAFSAAYVAAIGAAFADTAESEVGQLSRRPPRLVTTGRKVQPGTDGAVSLPGTLAGVAAAGLTAGLGLALGLVGGWGMGLLVALAAFSGTVADSLVGARLPRLGNEATNVLCTLVAAALALVPAFFVA
ncbi:MAG: Phytyl-phosphate kinase [uncultured Rubrobacteraceae bacterium]|uniref:Phytyl-phosphate kinase n=1 Tax=uncultured Rubrobacteraceae bacterium TaxID=349277 RepID=A0A6J4RGT3_9ACTN|nr:MAG: Phytyl-phosphate kinase [uncultured Rubrobacteraceae bacterium]